MSVRSLALGLTLGFFAGWVIFGTGPTAPDHPPPRPEKSGGA